MSFLTLVLVSSLFPSLGFLALRSYAATSTTTTVSCIVSSSNPPQFNCTAVVTGNSATGTVSWSTGSTGSGTFELGKTCNLVSLGATSQCSNFYNVGTSDSVVTLTVKYSGNSQNSASSGQVVLDLSQYGLAAATSAPTTATIQTATATTTGHSSTAATTNTSVIYSTTSSITTIASPGQSGPSIFDLEIILAAAVVAVAAMSFILVQSNRKIRESIGKK